MRLFTEKNNALWLYKCLWFCRAGNSFWLSAVAHHMEKWLKMNLFLPFSQLLPLLLILCLELRNKAVFAACLRSVSDAGAILPEVFPLYFNFSLGFPCLFFLLASGRWCLVWQKQSVKCLFCSALFRSVWEIYLKEKVNLPG